MRGVWAASDGGIRIDLSEQEWRLLEQLAAELRGVLSGQADPTIEARLFPPASSDPVVDAEYRMLTQDSLHADRLNALDRFVSTLAEGTGSWSVELDNDGAHAWLSVVNDARLVLGAALGIETETDWDRVRGHHDDPSSTVLAYLGGLEEELLEALTARLD